MWQLSQQSRTGGSRKQDILSHRLYPCINILKMKGTINLSAAYTQLGCQTCHLFRILMNCSDSEGKNPVKLILSFSRAEILSFWNASKHQEFQRHHFIQTQRWGFRCWTKVLKLLRSYTVDHLRGGFFPYMLEWPCEILSRCQPSQRAPQ